MAPFADLDELSKLKADFDKLIKRIETLEQGHGVIAAILEKLHPEPAVAPPVVAPVETPAA